MTSRILFVATSHTQLGDTGKSTGVWVDELVTPYYLLLDAGAVVEIASPRGGPIAFDPSSLKPAGQNEPLVERFLADPAAQARVRSTRAAASVDGTGFDAVFFPGGHGAMWDLPTDAGVTRVLEAAVEAGAWIASVCHGAAGLVGARGVDGRPVVAGRRINAFTDAEEEAVGLAGVVPFALETRLRELGAVFEKAAPWQAFAVRDGRFITGQNPQSSGLVARQLAEALGLAEDALKPSPAADR